MLLCEIVTVPQLSVLDHLYQTFNRNDHIIRHRILSTLQAEMDEHIK